MDFTIRLVHTSGGPITLSDEVCAQLCEMGTELIEMETFLAKFTWENTAKPNIPITMDDLLTEGQYAAGEGLVIMEQISTGKVLGFFKFVPSGTTAEIYYFVIHKDHRAGGLGNALIEQGKQYLRMLQFSEIMLYYKQENTAAVKFWDKNGFPPAIIVGGCKLF